MVVNYYDRIIFEIEVDNNLYFDHACFYRGSDDDLFEFKGSRRDIPFHTPRLIDRRSSRRSAMSLSLFCFYSGLDAD